MSSSNVERILSAVGLSVVALAASPALAQVKSWNAAAGNWGTAGNWSRVGIPGPGNFVFIGNTEPAQNAFVTLNVNSTIANLAITDGMALSGGNNQLIVNGAVVMSGKNLERGTTWPSRLIVNDGPALHDVITDEMTISDGASLELSDGIVLVNGVLTVEDTAGLFGDGIVLLNSDEAVSLFVDGNLGPGVGGMTLTQQGVGRIDLDGSAPGDMLNITVGMIDGSEFATLQIQGTGLADAMNDSIWLGGGNQLTMLLDEGWTLGSNATLLISSTFATEQPASINGAHLTMDADFDFLGTGAYALITAPATLNSTVSADLGPEDRLRFSGGVTLNGGQYTLGEDARIQFDGSTDVFGGTFSTFSTSFLDGYVDFNGATEYNGTVTFNGIARQTGDASVSGPTTINADVFDMDGAAAVASWSIANALVVNADSIEAGWGPFEGSMDITGTFLGKLTVNLTNPSDHWLMNGTLELGGVAAIMITRVAGSPVDVYGNLDITNGVQITAETRLEAGSSVDFASAAARLRFSSKTFVDDNCTFAGGGRLENAATGDMTLAQGTNLNSSELLNAGKLHLGQSPGLAFVDGLTFEPTSTWFVELGGVAPGFEHDQLQAFGPVQLAGQLNVQLIDLGAGIFEPSIGDTLTILTAPPAALNGVFANQPISFVPGNVYVWSVGYDAGGASSSVKLKLTDIIPCPADLNGDGEVNALDLAILLGAWGACPGCVADIDHDGIVGAADLAILLGEWGPCL